MDRLGSGLNPDWKKPFSRDSTRLKRYFILVLLITVGLYIWLLPWWGKHLILIHTILEALCIYIALLSFAVIWNTEEIASFKAQMLGFGFLAVALYNILHTIYFPPLGYYPPGYLDLSSRYGFLARLTLALLLLLSYYPVFQRSTRRWGALIITLGVALSVSYTVYTSPQAGPVLLNSDGVTPFKALIELLVIVLLAVTLPRLGSERNRHDLITNGYLQAAIPFLVGAELCFASYSDLAASSNLLGHLLRMAGYYFLYRGIFVSSISFPYRHLRRQTQHTTNILNQLTLGLITVDPQFRVTFANQEATHILGADARELVGQNIVTMAARLCRSDENQSRLELGLVAGHPQVDVVRKITTFRGDSVRLRIETRHLESGGYLCMFVPAKREQELKNLQLQTKTILDSVHDLVMLSDRRGRVVTCNLAFEQKTGLRKQDIQGKSLKDVIEMLHLQWSVPSGEQVGRLEGSYVCLANGEEKTALFQTAPILNVDREIIGYIICSTDITNFKQEMQELRQQEKLALVGQMAAGIVHEIKNPLTTIKGFSQILRKDAITWQEAYEYAAIIEQTTDDLNQVVMDFLSFARPRAPVFQSIWLNELLSSVRSMLDGHLFMKGIEVEYRLSNQDMEVIVDNGQIKQLLFNLVKNAVEAVQYQPHPVIQLATDYTPDENQALIQVKDNGKGMSADMLKRLGTPFFTTKDSGTGLGLSICYQIVSEHNGQIRVDSSPGKGTAFIIALPCHSHKSLWSMTS